MTSVPCPRICQNKPASLPMSKQLNPLMFQNTPVQPSCSVPKLFDNNSATRTVGLVRPL